MEGQGVHSQSGRRWEQSVLPLAFLHCVCDPAHAPDPTFRLSCYEGEGIAEFSSYIKERLKGKVAAFAGASGVGKSTLINALFPEMKLAAGEISRKIARGKHTTRHVELISSSGGYVFDTPGFSRLEADELRAENLWQYFPEIKEHHQTCRFRTCNHVGEPGCSVAQALGEGEIAQSRYDSYRMLYDKLKNIKEWERNNNND